MLFYAQTDARWAKQLLGYNTDPSFNIGTFGCVVTAWANMEKIAAGSNMTPADVNEWMKDHNGFVPGGGVFRWSVALGMGGVASKGTTSDIAAVNNFLEAAPNFAILEVRAGTRQHFVMAPWVDKIIDSEDGAEKNMSTYPFVNAFLYTALNLPTAPPPAPTSGDLNAVVQVTVPALNVRLDANAEAADKIVGTVHAGSVHVTGWKRGEQITIGAKTDNVWLRTDNMHFFTQAGTNANFGHPPANLTHAQSAHLYGASLYGGMKRLLYNSRNTKRKD